MINPHNQSDYIHAKQTKNRICVNCGSAENIIFHHVVPLCVGGTNRYENIVPLCASCHQKAHLARNLKDARRMGVIKVSGGRPKKEFSEYQKECLKQYILCRVPWSSISHQIGWTHFQRDYPVSMEVMESLDISAFKNNLELHLVGWGVVSKGEKIGWIQKAGTENKTQIFADRNIYAEEFGIKPSYYYARRKENHGKRSSK